MSNKRMRKQSNKKKEQILLFEQLIQRNLSLSQLQDWWDQLDIVSEHEDVWMREWKGCNIITTTSTTIFIIMWSNLMRFCYKKNYFDCINEFLSKFEISFFESNTRYTKRIKQLTLLSQCDCVIVWLERERESLSLPRPAIPTASALSCWFCAMSLKIAAASFSFPCSSSAFASSAIIATFSEPPIFNNLLIKLVNSLSVYLKIKWNMSDLEYKEKSKVLICSHIQER